MAVLLETSKGDLVIDLFVDECPIASKNFLKLCKIKYYNNVLFHNVQKGFLIQTGDPTGTGKGGDSVFKLLYGDQARCFEDEIRPTIRHKKKGMVGMASVGKDTNASQFYITTGEEIVSLDGKHTVFGEVAEGWDTVERINESFVDDDGRPLQNIRIKHTVVLDDPMDDPPGLEAHVPDASPVFERQQDDTRLEDDWVPSEDTRAMEEVEESMRKQEAKSRAVVLEMIGDLPDAEVAPPENVLFVCKLNPATTDEDLEIIFSRFGKIIDCEILKDKKTGDSLQYAFIGFETKEQAEAAYFKMDNVLIDDRRIHVDFSQSVEKIWHRFRRVKQGTDDGEGMGEMGDFGGGGRGRGRGHGGFGRGGSLQLGGRGALELKGGLVGARGVGGHGGGGYGMLRDGYSGGRGGGGDREDWLCAGCRNSNFARRTECYRCGAPRGAAAAAAAAAPALTARAGPPPPLPQRRSPERERGGERGDERSRHRHRSRSRERERQPERRHHHFREERRDHRRDDSRDDRHRSRH